MSREKLILTDHWIADAERMETPNVGDYFHGGLPDTIVIHFTGGRSARSSAEWLTNPDAKASAHVVVARDGSIIQLAPLQHKNMACREKQLEG